MCYKGHNLSKYPRISLKQHNTVLPDGFFFSNISVWIFIYRTWKYLQTILSALTTQTGVRGGGGGFQMSSYCNRLPQVFSLSAVHCTPNLFFSSFLQKHSETVLFLCGGKGVCFCMCFQAHNCRFWCQFPLPESQPAFVPTEWLAQKQRQEITSATTCVFSILLPSPVK